MRYNYKTIQIIGSKKFIDQTLKALRLVRKSEKHYIMVMRNLKKIKSSKQSEMILDKAQFNVANPSAFPKVEWYAGIIVHDAYHYALHSSGRLLWNKRTFREHARRCINQQMGFLRNIQAPQYMISYCKSSIKLKYWTKSFQKKNPSW